MPTPAPGLARLQPPSIAVPPTQAFPDLLGPKREAAQSIESSIPVGRCSDRVRGREWRRGCEGMRRFGAIARGLPVVGAAVPLGSALKSQAVQHPHSALNPPSSLNHNSQFTLSSLSGLSPHPSPPSV